MVRRSLAWPLLGVIALALAACGGAEDVAVEEPPAAPSASPPEPSATPEPTPPAADDGSGGRRASDVDPEPSARTAPADDEAADGTDPAPREPPVPAPPPGVEEAPAERQHASTGTETPEVDMLGDEDRRGAVDAPAIAIAHPAAGSERGDGPVTAAGEATVYEGTVLLTLIGPDGSVVEEAFTTATVGAPQRGRWSHTFATMADIPGRWRVVAAATDPSDGEGRPPARAEADFTVTGGR